jgi:hypothetical protein
MGAAPGLAPYAPPGAVGMVGAGTLQSAGVASGPTRRNALMTFLLPFAVMIGGAIFGAILAMIYNPLGFLIPIFYLGGAIWFLVLAIQMVNELKSVTRNPSFAWWPMFVPIYQYYWAWILVPQEVAKAKQMVGVQAPTRSIVLYIFLFHFALASDLNDLAR